MACLRDARDAESRAKLRAEQEAITAAGSVKALGSSDEERKRVLAVAVADHPGYQAALRHLRQVEAEHGRVEAQIETWKDERRASEWATRARMADALSRAFQLDGDPDDTATFDQALDQVADRLLHGLLARVVRRLPADEPMPF